ncbi:MAG: N-acetyltransferase [Saprospiraceae bacterium]|nr:N-acetyltransferase [Saprospiraceae bacterium]
MEVHIRQEESSDYTKVYQLIKEAFESMPLSDGSEQDLVVRLRQSAAFIPQLSLVATLNETIVGHILLTRLHIRHGTTLNTSLALAPVSVAPEYQGKGIGGKLIEKAHEIAKGLGFESIILIGHENYYPRFGYIQLNNFDIELPFEVPPQNAMVIELKKDALKNVSGEVVYDPAFFE